MKKEKKKKKRCLKKTEVDTVVQSSQRMPHDTRAVQQGVCSTDARIIRTAQGQSISSSPKAHGAHAQFFIPLHSSFPS